MHEVDRELRAKDITTILNMNLLTKNASGGKFSLSSFPQLNLLPFGFNISLHVYLFGLL